jgi:hypothetical protein
MTIYSYRRTLKSPDKSNKIYYFSYQTTNLINGKKYIGVHTTKNLDDGYLGSGKILKKAFRKYGLENFKREILEFFDTEKQMYEREANLITDEIISDSKFYNLKHGGEGGFSFINKNNIGTSLDTITNKITVVSRDDPRWKTKEIVGPQTGRKYFTDGIRNYFIYPNDPLTEKLQPGKIERKDSSQKHWYTNNEKEFHLYPEDKRIIELNLYLGRSEITKQKLSKSTKGIKRGPYKKKL